MGMVLHGIPDDVGDFVEPAIIYAFHGMHDPTLNRLQSIGDMRYGPFQDYIGGIIYKIVLIHSCESGDLYILPGVSLIVMSVQ